MNLACLLMTLVCLTTILLFSGNQSGSTSGTVIKQQQSASKQLGHDEPISESIDSADSLPLVSPPKAPLGSPASADFDDFSLLDERRDSIKFRRKSSETSDGPKVQNSEHEVEELTTTGGNSEQTPSGDKTGQQSDLPVSSGLFPLIDPILSQILNDMELGSLFKSIRRSSNTTGTGGSFLKPIIRRSKNGATIIISSGSFNESSLNDSSLALPSLIEKLLPPGLRPLSLGRLSGLESSNGTGPLGVGGIGTATITIGAEPIFAASSSPLSSGRLGPPPPFAAMDPFGFSSGHHLHDRLSPSSLFMEPMMGFRFPSPFMGSSSFGQPPPGLLSVLMRQAAQAESDDEPPAFAGPRGSHFLGPLGSFMGPSFMSQHSDQTIGKQTEQSKGNETNSNVQASQNSTQPQAAKLAANPLKPAESAPGTAIANESGAGAPPKTREQHKMQNLYSSSWKKPQASSMFIFSSGAPEPPSRDPFQFQLSPFSMPPMPQMMMLGGSSGEPQTLSGNSPLNPILRTILNSVRSDLDERNKTERAQQAGSQRASGSSMTPHWTSLGSPAAEMDDEWNGNQSDADRWDEQNGAKQMRARHRSADDEADTTSMEGSDFVSNFQLDQANNDLLMRGPDRSPLESASGIVSGTIRQTIRGPGMTVERIIEVPSSRFQQAQQVGAGIRSQSLSSRPSPQSADMIDDMGDYMGPSRMASSSPSMSLNSLFSRSASDRMSSGGSGFEDFPMPHVGFIGRLLSDMSKHVSGNAGRDFQVGASRGGSVPTIKNRSLEEELDEGDSNESFKMEAEKERWPADESRSKAERWRKKIESSRAKWGPDSDWYRKTHESKRRKQMSDDEFGVASPSQSEAVFVQPSHLIIPDSFNVDQDKEINLMPPHLFNGSGEPSKLVASGSFEDTMNSMENRMNHVLSMASHNPFPGLASKPIGAEEQTVDRASGNKSAERMVGQQVASTRSTAPSNNMIYLSEIGRMDPKQATSGLNVPHSFQPHHQFQPQQAQKLIQQVENPFTSPSSPLFGFPASSVASGTSSQQVAKDEKSKMIPSSAVPANGSNRKQRSFTYHSNNELASSIAQKQQQQQQQREQLGASESMGRPRFMTPFEVQPASTIMGRRLDDRPNPSEGMQMMDHPFGKPAPTAFDGRNLINHHTGSFAGTASNQPAENYRTIVI